MIKYGLLVNEENENLGDDIQSYAEAQFLPRVDVICDREHLDTFKYGDGKEPVALIMGAWFMWRKYNWPPAKQIVPLNIGYHHFDREKNVFKSPSYAIPIVTQHYNGIGGQWFKDHGKVGCRDLYTCDILNSVGIPNYFSGCVTLTLPKQKTTKDKGKYVVLVDLNPKVEEKVRSLIGNKYEIRKVTHKTASMVGSSWEARKKRVEEYLTLYQNAKYVVTRRLHVALPCLAMGVPVMVILKKKMNDPNRFEPYKKWLYCTSNSKFMKNGYSNFDFVNGTANKEDYKETREKLIETINEFVDFCEKNKNKPLSFFDKTSYNEEELLRWKADFLKETLDNTHTESKQMHAQLVTEKKRSVLYIASNRFYQKYIEGKKIENNKFIKKIKNKIQLKK